MSTLGSHVVGEMRRNGAYGRNWSVSNSSSELSAPVWCVVVCTCGDVLTLAESVGLFASDGYYCAVGDGMSLTDASRECDGMAVSDGGSEPGEVFANADLTVCEVLGVVCEGEEQVTDFTLTRSAVDDTTTVVSCEDTMPEDASMVLARFVVCLVEA